MERTALLIDQRAVLETSVELSVDDDVACVVEWDGLRADLEKVTAAYVRPYDPLGVPAVASAGKESAAARHAVAVYEALEAMERNDLGAGRQSIERDGFQQLEAIPIGTDTRGRVLPCPKR